MVSPWRNSCLRCVNDFLDQAVKLVGEAEVYEGEALLNLTATLLGHSITLVEHIGRQECCGMGEVPSLPELLPPILTAAFSCVKVSRLVSIEFLAPLAVLLE